MRRLRSQGQWESAGLAKRSRPPWFTPARGASQERLITHTALGSCVAQRGAECNAEPSRNLHKWNATRKWLYCKHNRTDCTRVSAFTRTLLCVKYTHTHSNISKVCLILKCILWNLVFYLIRFLSKKCFSGMLKKIYIKNIYKKYFCAMWSYQKWRATNDT